MEKIALVTGASRGIGRAVAAELARRGWAVCIGYRVRQDKAEELAAELAAEGCRVMTCQADVSQQEQVEAMVRRVEQTFGAVSLLVNNAGIAGQSLFQELTDERWHEFFSVNVDGAFYASRAVLPHMRAQGGGRIVCMSSIAGIVPIPFQLWYSVSKAAIIAYVLALQNEVRPFGISVCAIMPGDIASGFTDARRKSAAGDDVYAGRIERSVAVMEHDERTGMTPEYAGNFVAKYALKKSSRPLVAMGIAYKGAAAIAKLFPRRLSNWIVGQIYAK